MALNPGWTVTGSRSGNPIYQYDPEVAKADYTEAKSALQDTRNKIVDLYNTVGGVYTGLVNAGRQEEAASLRDAAERFARAGSQTGVSSDARIGALQDLAGKLRVAGQVAEGNIQAQGIDTSLNILRTLADLDQGILNQSFRESFSVSQTPSQTPIRTQRIVTPTPRTPVSTKTTVVRTPDRSGIDAAMAANQRWLETNRINAMLRGTQGAGGSPIMMGWSDAITGGDVPRQWASPIVGPTVTPKPVVSAGTPYTTGQAPIIPTQIATGKIPASTTTPSGSVTIAGRTLTYDPITKEFIAAGQPTPFTVARKKGEDAAKLPETYLPQALSAVGSEIGRGATNVAKWAASPIWWPAKKAGELIYGK